MDSILVGDLVDCSKVTSDFEGDNDYGHDEFDTYVIFNV
jgi:hypothetical protein